MSQNLPAPCYQVYAASRLASLPFRKADLATRGLIFTMEMECWVNHRLPQTYPALAKVLGIAVEEVSASLPAAMTYFKIDDQGIYSPQLEDYRAHLKEIREKQKIGGKKGADITNKNRKHSTKHGDIKIASDSGKTQVHPQVETRVSSKANLSTVNQNQTQPLEKGITPVANSVRNDEWKAGYETSESCTESEYTKISRGG